VPNILLLHISLIGLITILHKHIWRFLLHLFGLLTLIGKFILKVLKLCPLEEERILCKGDIEWHLSILIQKINFTDNCWFFLLLHLNHLVRIGLCPFKYDALIEFRYVIFIRVVLIYVPANLFRDIIFIAGAIFNLLKFLNIPLVVFV